VAQKNTRKVPLDLNEMANPVAKTEILIEEVCDTQPVNRFKMSIASPLTATWCTRQ